MSKLTLSRIFFSITALISCFLLSGWTAQKTQEQKVGLIDRNEKAFTGYTLFAPILSTKTYLIDMDGQVVHTWKSQYHPGQSVYLLENGNLLRTCFLGHGENPAFQGGGSGGGVQEITWDGEIVWDFKYSSKNHLLHHDIERLPNGNVLMIAWEHKRRGEAIASGRDPKSMGPDGLWSDYIIEVKPTGKNTGEIVWEWHVWDHLIQEYDRSKSNYGKVSKHPERININPINWMSQLSQKMSQKLQSLGYIKVRTEDKPDHAHPDWVHTNSIDYNADLDQIILSVLGFSEVWIIDHSTSFEEASGYRGGRYGKGGDLLYRWGNPQVYQTGTQADQRFFVQHDAQWIPRGLSGEGNIIVFNNGRGRPDGDYSSIDEICPAVNSKGKYTRKKNKAFGPNEIIWTYQSAHKADFYSIHISGVQRLPNGNTLICSGEKGIIFEVTSDKEVVWSYINPFKGKMPPMKIVPQKKPNPTWKRRQNVPRPGNPGRDNSVFRAYRYGPDYPGLKGKELSSLSQKDKK